MEFEFSFGMTCWLTDWLGRLIWFLVPNEALRTGRSRRLGSGFRSALSWCRNTTVRVSIFVRRSLIISGVTTSLAPYRTTEFVVSWIAFLEQDNLEYNINIHVFISYSRSITLALSSITTVSILFIFPFSKQFFAPPPPSCIFRPILTCFRNCATVGLGGYATGTNRPSEYGTPQL